ncbi:MAG TPA: hypothetical protein DDZ67_12305, partial [Xanthomonadaceae bacterium]|nr:hypothetical protein [Xanthomonadaceae bacterium]
MTLSVAVVLLLLTWLVYRQSASAYETKSQQGLATATHVVQDTVALYNRALIEDTERLTGGFSAMLPPGPAGQDHAHLLERGDFSVPDLTFGGKSLPTDHKLVDRFTEATSAVATVFSRSGDDFVRISTSLTNENGERVIGTALDHKHAAYPLVSSGKPYTGRAKLFGRDYMTHYQPLLDVEGKVIGILFVGVNYGDGLVALKERLRQLRVGADGYFFVVDNADGDAKGSVVVHPSSEGVKADTLVAERDRARFQKLIDGSDAVAVLDVAAKSGDPAIPATVSVEHFAPWKWALVGVEPRTQLTATLRHMMGIMLLLSAVAIGLLAALVFTASRRMVGQPLAHAARIAREIAAGRLDNAVGVHGRDEAGQLLESMDTMQRQVRSVIAAQREMARHHDEGTISHRMDESLFPGDYGAMVRDTNALVAGHIEVKTRLIELMQRYAIGDLSLDMEALPGEKAVISDTMAQVKRSLIAINAEAKRLSAAAAAGDFSVRGDAEAFQHDFRAMIQALNLLMETTDDNLGQVSTLLQAIAEGDLTARMHGQFQGVFASMRDDANTTVQRLTEIVGRIQAASSSINLAAGEIATGNSDLSRRTEQQAANLEETAASMEELTSTVRQ